MKFHLTLNRSNQKLVNYYFKLKDKHQRMNSYIEKVRKYRIRMPRVTLPCLLMLVVQYFNAWILSYVMLSIAFQLAYTWELGKDTHMYLSVVWRKESMTAARASGLSLDVYSCGFQFTASLWDLLTSHVRGGDYPYLFLTVFEGWKRKTLVKIT